MKQFIDKLISRLEKEKEGAKRRKSFDSEISYSCAIRIVNQLAEEYNNKSVKGDLISRSALLEEIKSLRVTVMGLRAGKGILAEYANQYKDTLLRVIEEQPTANNDGWIPCNREMPKIGEFDVKKFWVTMHHKVTNCYFTKKLNWNNYLKCWEWKNGKEMSKDWEVIAWMQIEIPAPYQPKGE